LPNGRTAFENGDLDDKAKLAIGSPMSDRTSHAEYLAKCIDDALTGLFDKAQVWKPFAGILGMWLILSVLGRATLLPQSLIGQAWFELGRLVVSAALVFAWRFIGAPARLDHKASLKITRLEREIQTLSTKPLSEIVLRLEDGVVVEFDTRDADDNSLPPMVGFFVNAKNTGAKTARNCQIFLCHQPPLGYPMRYAVSAPFDLQPGADQDFPVIRYREEDADTRALMFFLDPESWKIAAKAPAWLCPPGEYEIKVFSDDNHAAVLKAELSTDHDFSKRVQRKWFFKPKT
jgi:hypothetical protein